MARPTYNPAHVTMQDAKTGEIPFAESEQILTDILHGSAFLQLATPITMTKPREKFTHMSGVDAYWVDETQSIPTSAPSFDHYEMVAKKIGVIIPTSRENLMFSITNFFQLVTPQIAEAFYKLIDAAAIANVSNPFDHSIMGSATKTGQILTETTNKYDDINKAMSLIEANDFVPNGVASTNKQKVLYRATKDTTGMPIFNEPTNGEPARVVGLPVSYLWNAAFGSTQIAEIVGDWKQAYYGILRGIEYHVSEEASIPTLTPSDGIVPVSMFQRDMAAIRATMHIGIMVRKDEAFTVVQKPATP